MLVVVPPELELELLLDELEELLEDVEPVLVTPEEADEDEALELEEEEELVQLVR